MSFHNRLLTFVVNPQVSFNKWNLEYIAESKFLGIYVKLKDRKCSLSGKNDHNLLWHMSNAKFRVVAVFKQPQRFVACEDMPWCKSHVVAVEGNDHKLPKCQLARDRAAIWWFLQPCWLIMWRRFLMTKWRSWMMQAIIGASFFITRVKITTHVLIVIILTLLIRYDTSNNLHNLIVIVLML